MNPRKGEAASSMEVKELVFLAFLADLHEERRLKKLMERVKYEWGHFEVELIDT